VYSVNGKSYLFDPGYDSAGPTTNSKWNEFFHHNSPYLTKNRANNVIEEGGFASPYLPSTEPFDIYINLFGLVKIKIYTVPPIPLPPYIKKSDHQPAYTFLDENNEDFTIISGYTNHVQTDGVSVAKIATDYKRNVILVKDAEPYLIDINQVKNKGQLMGSNFWNGWSMFYQRFQTFTTTNYIDEFTMRYNLPLNSSPDTNSIVNFSNSGVDAISATQKAYHYFSDNKNLSFSIGKNFSNGLMGYQGVLLSSFRHNKINIKESGDSLDISSFRLVGENGIAANNYYSHAYSEESLNFAREIYGTQSFVGVFKADATSAMNDLYKYEYIDMNTKNMVTMYFIEKNSSEMDVVVTYSNNDVGNQILNLKYPTKLIDLTQFANTKKGYSFFQLLKVNGNWTYKSKFNANVYYTANTTINTSQIEASSGISVANNITLTIVGSGNLNETTISLGNNAKVKFTSGNVELQNASFHPIYPADNYIVKSMYPSIIKIPNSSKVTIQGRPSFTGYRLQIDQGGELEIKDGSLASFTDSFSFLNYGTTKIGAGVTLNLKNFSNYSSSNTLINTNNGSRTYFNISSGGVINFGGLATVKGTTFRRKTTSNFSYVGISGSAIRSFENVAIEGSQYGILVSNVPSGNQTLFKNVTGNANYYSTIKSTNSSFVIDGFEGENAVQDGISAYSGSVLTLKGIINATDNLLGLRSAYNSNVNYSDANGTVTLKSNTRGIHTYNDSRVDFTAGEYFLWGNNRTDNLYGGIEKYDLYAVNTSHIYIKGNFDGIHKLSEYKEAPSTITKINMSGGNQVNSSKDVIIGNENDKRSISKKAFLQAFWDAKKAENKQALKELIRDNSSNSKQEIRSKAITLDVLNLSQEADFSWVSLFSKRAKLRSLVEEDAMLIAEQLFYYFTKEEPNQSEARYWLEQLKDMKYDVVETGIFDVLFEQAEFEQAEGSKSESETIDEEIASNVVLAYPNPFNPTTSLKLSLKNKAQVQIQVFDVMGRLVQTLANNEQWQSGTHEVQFDASRLASGMYFARTQILESGKAVQTQVTKLMIISRSLPSHFLSQQ